ncbi:MAG: phosphotransferase [Chthoniobacterales bacterium]
MTSLSEIEEWLREDGQVGDGPVVFTPLTGGVSCEIYKVAQGAKVFVLKRALAQLRVAAEWKADVSRNATEYLFYHEMAEPLEGFVPRVLFHNPVRGYFLMEYLEEDWKNWKQEMLRGVMDVSYAQSAGELMGKLHGGSWQDGRMKKLFATTANFRQLRTDPYLRTTAERLPEVRELLLAEADRLENNPTCLVHGDFSPKNMLVKGTRILLLDAEVAWFGDPAFDIAFLHTHLFLKALHLPAQRARFLQMSESAWTTYKNVMGDRVDETLESHGARLLAMLLLARVDGKSPVEYLNADQQAIVRNFFVRVVKKPFSRMDEIRNAWGTHLEQLPNP